MADENEYIYVTVDCDGDYVEMPVVLKIHAQDEDKLYEYAEKYKESVRRVPIKINGFLEYLDGNAFEFEQLDISSRVSLD